MSDPSKGEQSRLPTAEADSSDGGQADPSDGGQVDPSDDGAGADPNDASGETERNGGSAGAGSPGEGPAPRPRPPETRQERVEVALDLLAYLECEELGLAEAVDRIETVTTDPALTREILDEAEKRGIVEREDGRLQTRRGGTFVRFESQVVQREGEFECRRCGAGLSTGHFVQFDAGELGPFGSSCIRKVMGRE